MTIDRMDRIEEMLKREISVILQNDINDPRIEHVTITRVEAARDLRNAKIFYTVPIGEAKKEKEDTRRGLESASGFMRKELADRISMKFMPCLSFVEDKENEKEESVDRIFEEIDKEHHISEPDEEKGADNG